MTEQEVMQLARDAGCIKEYWLEFNANFMQRFAALVAEREREACLAEIETGIWLDKTTEEVLAEIAAAIHTRGKEGGTPC